MKPVNQHSNFSSADVEIVMTVKESTYASD